MDTAFWAQALRITSVVLGVVAACCVAGAYYFERQVQRQKDARIAELQRRANIIQSIQLRINIDSPGQGQASGRVDTFTGLQSVVALLTREQTLLRFTSNFSLAVQQIAADVRQVRFVYTPESATEILGRPISFLENVDKLVANYSEIFREIGVSTSGDSIRLRLTVLVNGVDVVSADRSLGLGVIESGQTEVDVADAFAGLAGRYGKRIEEKVGSTLR